MNVKIKSYNLFCESLKSRATVSGKYLELFAENNGLRVVLTEEGKEEIQELNDKKNGIVSDIMYDLFEDIQGNSEFLFHHDMGVAGFGLTSAEGITDGYYIDDNGNYHTEYPISAKVYWFPAYETTSIVDELIDKGEVFFDLAD